MTAIDRSRRVWLAEYLLPARDGAGCWYCGEPFGREGQSQRTLEHLIPLAVARLWHDWNLVLAHLGCNQAAHVLRLREKFALRDALRAKTRVPIRRLTAVEVRAARKRAKALQQSFRGTGKRRIGDAVGVGPYRHVQASGARLATLERLSRRTKCLVCGKPQRGNEECDRCTDWAEEMFA